MIVLATNRQLPMVTISKERSVASRCVERLSKCGPNRLAMTVGLNKLNPVVLGQACSFAPLKHASGLECMRYHLTFIGFSGASFKAFCQTMVSSHYSIPPRFLSPFPSNTSLLSLS